MNIKYTARGCRRGKVSVAETARTMEVGEEWRLALTDANQLANTRVACCALGKETGRFFNVTTDNNDIIIRRKE